MEADSIAVEASPLCELLQLCECLEESSPPPQPGGNQSADDVTSLNMWGDCRPDNYAKSVRRARLFKPARLALFTRVKLALESAGIEYALYGGSALAVYRESGQMIAHDSDVDLVARESDFTRLAEVGQRMAAEPGGEVACDLACGLTGRKWIEHDAIGQQRDVPYDGRGCKRLKFSLTESGWSAVGLWRSGEPRRFPFDPCLVHLDIFTVSPHPLDPGGSLRVNWSVPGLYDPLTKRFPADCLFPAAPCLFEGIGTFAPRHLAAYLTVEYGYLGRDAVYNPATGLYARMPEEIRARLRGVARARLTLDDEHAGIGAGLT